MWTLITSKVRAVAVGIVCVVLALAYLMFLSRRSKQKDKKIAELERAAEEAKKQAVVAAGVAASVGEAAETVANIRVETEKKKAEEVAAAEADMEKIREEAAIVRNIGTYGGTVADAWNTYAQLKKGK